MGDVDYLVEDNTTNDFCLSPEMDGTHGKYTSEDDPSSAIENGSPWETCTMAIQAGNKMQMLEMFQPSYLPEIQI